MRKALKTIAWLSVSVLSCVVPALAADVTLHGKVADDSGKPIRGAEVRATAAGKSITRFSQDDGRYELPLAVGKYEIAADAYGFTTRRSTVDTSDNKEVDFTLAARWEASRLSGADIDHMLPNEAPANLLRASCTSCHSFDIILHQRGKTASEWKGFIPTMTRGRRPNPVFSPEKLDALSSALEKYFGPDARYFGPDADPPTQQQVSHPQLDEAVLAATIHEWTIPSGVDSFPHSIEVANPGLVYFSEVGLRVSKFGRFELETEKFTEYPAPNPNPHTGVVAKDGRVWFTMALHSPTAPHLTVLNPEDGSLTSFQYQGKEDYTAHTPVLDKDGNVWISVEYHGKPGDTLTPGEVWRFDVKTKQFRDYKFPVPATYPKASSGDWGFVPTDSESRSAVNTYHLGVDSKGKIWASVLQLGMIVSIDPVTGKTAEYMAPNTPGIRGMMVDSHDNVWFGDFFNHQLGKLDTKTGQFKMYQPPTKGASPYGVIEDKKTGYIWFADFSGSNLTRFDPKTEKFVEYPLFSHPSIPRFIDVDAKSRIWFTEYWTGRIGYLETGDTAKQSAALR